MCDCFHLFLPNWQGSPASASNKPLKSEEPDGDQDDDDTTIEVELENVRPRPQGSSPVYEYAVNEYYIDPEDSSVHAGSERSSSIRKTSFIRTTHPFAKMADSDEPMEVTLCTDVDPGGKGFTIAGGGTDGIIVSQVVKEDPHSNIFSIKEGDQLLSATIYFDNIRYEDAIQILQHSEPYKVQFQLKRKLGREDREQMQSIFETKKEKQEKKDVFATSENLQGDHAVQRREHKKKRSKKERLSWPKFQSLTNTRFLGHRRSQSTSETNEDETMDAYSKVTEATSEDDELFIMQKETKEFQGMEIHSRKSGLERQITDMKKNKEPYQRLKEKRSLDNTINVQVDQHGALKPQMKKGYSLESTTVSSTRETNWLGRKYVSPEVEVIIVKEKNLPSPCKVSPAQSRETRMSEKTTSEKSTELKQLDISDDTSSPTKKQAKDGKQRKRKTRKAKLGAVHGTELSGQSKTSSDAFNMTWTAETGNKTTEVQLSRENVSDDVIALTSETIDESYIKLPDHKSSHIVLSKDSELQLPIFQGPSFAVSKEHDIKVLESATEESSLSQQPELSGWKLQMPIIKMPKLPKLHRKSLRSDSTDQPNEIVSDKGIDTKNIEVKDSPIFSEGYVNVDQPSQKSQIGKSRTEIFAPKLHGSIHLDEKLLETSIHIDPKERQNINLEMGEKALSIANYSKSYSVTPITSSQTKSQVPLEETRVSDLRWKSSKLFDDRIRIENYISKPEVDISYPDLMPQYDVSSVEHISKLEGQDKDKASLDLDLQIKSDNVESENREGLLRMPRFKMPSFGSFTKRVTEGTENRLTVDTKHDILEITNIENKGTAITGQEMEDQQMIESKIKASKKLPKVGISIPKFKGHKGHYDVSRMAEYLKDYDISKYDQQIYDETQVDILDLVQPDVPDTITDGETELTGQKHKTEFPSLHVPHEGLSEKFVETDNIMFSQTDLDDNDILEISLKDTLRKESKENVNVKSWKIQMPSVKIPKVSLSEKKSIEISTSTEGTDTQETDETAISKRDIEEDKHFKLPTYKPHSFYLSGPVIKTSQLDASEQNEENIFLKEDKSKQIEFQKADIIQVDEIEVEKKHDLKSDESDIEKLGSPFKLPSFKLPSFSKKGGFRQESTENENLQAVFEQPDIDKDTGIMADIKIKSKKKKHKIIKAKDKTDLEIKSKHLEKQEDPPMDDGSEESISVDKEKTKSDLKKKKQSKIKIPKVELFRPFTGDDLHDIQKLKRVSISKTEEFAVDTNDISKLNEQASEVISISSELREQNENISIIPTKIHKKEIELKIQEPIEDDQKKTMFELVNTELPTFDISATNKVTDKTEITFAQNERTYQIQNTDNEKMYGTFASLNQKLPETSEEEEGSSIIIDNKHQDKKSKSYFTKIKIPKLELLGTNAKIKESVRDEHSSSYVQDTKIQVSSIKDGKEYSKKYGDETISTLSKLMDDTIIPDAVLSISKSENKASKPTLSDSIHQENKVVPTPDTDVSKLDMSLKTVVTLQTALSEENEKEVKTTAIKDTKQSFGWTLPALKIPLFSSTEHKTESTLQEARKTTALADIRPHIELKTQSTILQDEIKEFDITKEVLIHSDSQTQTKVNITQAEVKEKTNYTETESLGWKLPTFKIPIFRAPEDDPIIDSPVKTQIDTVTKTEQVTSDVINATIEHKVRTDRALDESKLDSVRAKDEEETLPVGTDSSFNIQISSFQDPILSNVNELESVVSQIIAFTKKEESGKEAEIETFRQEQQVPKETTLKSVTEKDEDNEIREEKDRDFKIQLTSFIDPILSDVDEIESAISQVISFTTKDKRSVFQLESLSGKLAEKSEPLQVDGTILSTDSEKFVTEDSKLINTEEVLNKIKSHQKQPSVQEGDLVKEQKLETIEVLTEGLDVDIQSPTKENVEGKDKVRTQRKRITKVEKRDRSVSSPETETRILSTDTVSSISKTKSELEEMQIKKTSTVEIEIKVPAQQDDKEVMTKNVGQLDKSVKKGDTDLSFRIPTLSFQDPILNNVDELESVVSQIISFKKEEESPTKVKPETSTEEQRITTETTLQTVTEKDEDENKQDKKETSFKIPLTSFRDSILCNVDEIENTVSHVISFSTINNVTTVKSKDSKSPVSEESQHYFAEEQVEEVESPSKEVTVPEEGPTVGGEDLDEELRPETTEVRTEVIDADKQSPMEESFKGKGKVRKQRKKIAKVEKTIRSVSSSEAETRISPTDSAISISQTTSYGEERQIKEVSPDTELKVSFPQEDTDITTPDIGQSDISVKTEETIEKSLPVQDSSRVEEEELKIEGQEDDKESLERTPHTFKIPLLSGTEVKTEYSAQEHSEVTAQPEVTLTGEELTTGTATLHEIRKESQTTQAVLADSDSRKQTTGDISLSEVEEKKEDTTAQSSGWGLPTFKLPKISFFSTSEEDSKTHSKIKPQEVVTTVTKTEQVTTDIINTKVDRIDLIEHIVRTEKDIDTTEAELEIVTVKEEEETLQVETDSSLKVHLPSFQVPTHSKADETEDVVSQAISVTKKVERSVLQLEPLSGKPSEEPETVQVDVTSISLTQSVSPVSEETKLESAVEIIEEEVKSTSEEVIEPEERPSVTDLDKDLKLETTKVVTEVTDADLQSPTEESVKGKGKVRKQRKKITKVEKTVRTVSSSGAETSVSPTGSAPSITQTKSEVEKSHLKEISPDTEIKVSVTELTTTDKKAGQLDISVTTEETIEKSISAEDSSKVEEEVKIAGKEDDKQSSGWTLPTFKIPLFSETEVKREISTLEQSETQPDVSLTQGEPSTQISTLQEERKESETSKEVVEDSESKTQTADDISLSEVKEIKGDTESESSGWRLPTFKLPKIPLFTTSEDYSRIDSTIKSQEDTLTKTEQVTTVITTTKIDRVESTEHKVRTERELETTQAELQSVTGKEEEETLQVETGLGFKIQLPSFQVPILSNVGDTEDVVSQKISVIKEVERSMLQLETDSGKPSETSETVSVDVTIISPAQSVRSVTEETKYVAKDLVEEVESPSKEVTVPEEGPTVGGEDLDEELRPETTEVRTEVIDADKQSPMEESVKGKGKVRKQRKKITKVEKTVRSVSSSEAETRISPTDSAISISQTTSYGEERQIKEVSPDTELKVSFPQEDTDITTPDIGQSDISVKTEETIEKSLPVQDSSRVEEEELKIEGQEDDKESLERTPHTFKIPLLSGTEVKTEYSAQEHSEVTAQPEVTLTGEELTTGTATLHEIRKESQTTQAVLADSDSRKQTTGDISLSEVEEKKEDTTAQSSGWGLPTFKLPKISFFSTSEEDSKTHSKIKPQEVVTTVTKTEQVTTDIINTKVDRIDLIEHIVRTEKDIDTTEAELEIVTVKEEEETLQVETDSSLKVHLPSFQVPTHSKADETEDVVSQAISVTKKVERSVLQLEPLSGKPSEEPETVQVDVTSISLTQSVSPVSEETKLESAVEIIEEEVKSTSEEVIEPEERPSVTDLDKDLKLETTKVVTEVTDADLQSPTEESVKGKGKVRKQRKKITKVEKTVRTVSSSGAETSVSPTGSAPSITQTKSEVEKSHLKEISPDTEIKVSVTELTTTDKKAGQLDISVTTEETIEKSISAEDSSKVEEEVKIAGKEDDKQSSGWTLPTFKIPLFSETEVKREISTLEQSETQPDVSLTQGEPSTQISTLQEEGKESETSKEVVEDSESKTQTADDISLSEVKEIKGDTESESSGWRLPTFKLPKIPLFTTSEDDSRIDSTIKSQEEDTLTKTEQVTTVITTTKIDRVESTEHKVRTQRELETTEAELQSITGKEEEETLQVETGLGFKIQLPSFQVPILSNIGDTEDVSQKISVIKELDRSMLPLETHSQNPSEKSETMRVDFHQKDTDDTIPDIDQLDISLQTEETIEKPLSGEVGSSIDEKVKNLGQEVSKIPQLTGLEVKSEYSAQEHSALRSVKPSEESDAVQVDLKIISPTKSVSTITKETRIDTAVGTKDIVKSLIDEVTNSEEQSTLPEGDLDKDLQSKSQRLTAEEKDETGNQKYYTEEIIIAKNSMDLCEAKDKRASYLEEITSMEDNSRIDSKILQPEAVTSERPRRVFIRQHSVPGVGVTVHQESISIADEDFPSTEMGLMDQSKDVLNITVQKDMLTQKDVLEDDLWDMGPEFKVSKREFMKHSISTRSTTQDSKQYAFETATELSESKQHTDQDSNILMQSPMSPRSEIVFPKYSTRKLSVSVIGESINIGSEEGTRSNVDDLALEKNAAVQDQQFAESQQFKTTEENTDSEGWKFQIPGLRMNIFSKSDKKSSTVAESKESNAKEETVSKVASKGNETPLLAEEKSKSPFKLPSFKLPSLSLRTRKEKSIDYDVTNTSTARTDIEADKTSSQGDFSTEIKGDTDVQKQNVENISDPDTEVENKKSSLFSIKPDQSKTKLPKMEFSKTSIKTLADNSNIKVPASIIDTSQANEDQTKKIVEESFAKIISLDSTVDGQQTLICDEKETSIHETSFEEQVRLEFPYFKTPVISTISSQDVISDTAATKQDLHQDEAKVTENVDEQLATIKSTTMLLTTKAVNVSDNLGDTENDTVVSQEKYDLSITTELKGAELRRKQRKVFKLSLPKVKMPILALSSPQDEKDSFDISASHDGSGFVLPEYDLKSEMVLEGVDISCVANKSVQDITEAVKSKDNSIDESKHGMSTSSSESTEVKDSVQAQDTETSMSIDTIGDKPQEKAPTLISNVEIQSKIVTEIQETEMSLKEHEKQSGEETQTVKLSHISYIRCSFPSPDAEAPIQSDKDFYSDSSSAEIPSEYDNVSPDTIKTVEKVTLSSFSSGIVKEYEISSSKMQSPSYGFSLLKVKLPEVSTTINTQRLESQKEVKEDQTVISEGIPTEPSQQTIIDEAMDELNKHAQILSSKVHVPKAKTFTFGVKSASETTVSVPPQLKEAEVADAEVAAEQKSIKETEVNQKSPTKFKFWIPNIGFSSSVDVTESNKVDQVEQLDIQPDKDSTPKEKVPWYKFPKLGFSTEKQKSVEKEKPELVPAVAKTENKDKEETSAERSEAPLVEPENFKTEEDNYPGESSAK